jgi:hypothetical protein
MDVLGYPVKLGLDEQMLAQVEAQLQESQAAYKQAQSENNPPGTLPVLFYRAALPLSRQALTFTAGVIRRHRAAIGSLRRKLNPARRPCSSWCTCAKESRSLRSRPGSE